MPIVAMKKAAIAALLLAPHLAPALEVREAAHLAGDAASFLESHHEVRPVSFLELNSKGMESASQLQAASAESNRHLFSNRHVFGVQQGSGQQAHAAMKQKVLKKVAHAIIKDQRKTFQHLSMEERITLAKRVAHQEDTTFIDLVAPSVSASKPVLVEPPEHMSMLELGAQSRNKGHSFQGAVGAAVGEFQPSMDFQRDAAAELTEAASDLPEGIGSPKTGDSLPNFQYSRMPTIDFPKEFEYSLEAGDTFKSFSNKEQDVKLITQVLKNVTNGFFLDTNAGDGEQPSNTLLLELTGWRGLVMEPRGYWYLNLWSKMRKAWLFLGCISPNANSTKIGFDTNGNIDMLSGHMIHAHSVATFLEEMGGRKTIDFWNLKAGGYESEILQETLLGTGKFIEFGVIMVTFKGRQSGRGFEPYVQPRTRDTTEELIFTTMRDGGLKYIGGMDPYWVGARYDFHDSVFVNPSYFEKRGFAVPTTIKGAPPVGGTPERQAVADAWDSGLSKSKEIAEIVDYIAKSKEAAAAGEPLAKASRVPSASELKLL